MGSQIKAGLDQRNSEQLAKMQEFFANSSVMSDAEEAEVLAKMQSANEAKKAEMDNYSKRVAEIMKAMADGNREMTLEEQQELAGIRKNMKTDALKALSEQEVESKVLLERMKSYSDRITAEQAGEIIKNVNKARDESIAAAEQQYDETVANIIRQRDETGAITTEQAEQMIAEAGRQRDDSIAKAEELRAGVVDKFKSAHADIAAQVSDQDGSIKDGWVRLRDWFDQNPITQTIKRLFTNVAESNTEAPAGLATGTNYFKGGLTWVGEKGPELVELPRGTKVYNNRQSMELAKMAADSYNFMSPVPAVSVPDVQGGKSIVQHTGTIKVEGVNNRGQLLEIVDIIVDQMRREART
jgi:hypothetical protein